MMVFAALQQLAQLVAADVGFLQDTVQGAGLEVLIVHGHGHWPTPAWVDQDVVAAANAIQLPTATFKSSNELFGCNRWELVAQAGWTAMRRRSTFSIGQP